VGERITKAMPAPVMGKDVPLAKLFDATDKRYGEGAEFRALYESDADVKTVVDTAKDLEGLKRQWGVHAAGVIMSSEPLIDIIPIMRREQDGAIITQFDYPTCEALGLIKMDFLGLRNLTVLDDAVGNIKLNRGFDLVLEDLELDDAPTYALLGRGDTLGVFQLDGGPMRSLLRLMRPDNFEDISAVLALYRPGPMGADSHTNYALRKNGRQEITPIHAELEEPLAEILGTTHGLIVYQEQVLQIAQKVAGYSLGNADLLRKAMGKKKKEVLDAEFVPFRDGMRAGGYSDPAIKALWDILVPFSDYAFNKAHTAAYGLVSYWTAYLKANFPAEFMAALLTSVADDKDKMAIYLAECRRMGIQVLPPDVNESAANFTPVGTDIRFGLTAVRNVGSHVVEGIVSAREEHGKAVNFHGFLDQVPLVVCNKRVIESLVKAGAFDSMGHTRRGLMSVYDAAIDGVLDLKRNEAHGQDDLFGGGMLGEAGETDPVLMGRVPDLPDWDKRTKLAFEREMLGLYVSDHPLQGLEHLLAGERDVGIGQLIAEEGPREGQVTIAGMITSVTRKTTRRGDIWAVLTVEDLEASIEVLLFPKAYDQVSTVLATDVVVKVKGRVKVDDDAVSLNASELTLPDISEAPAGPVVISLPAIRCTPAVLDQLREVLAQHPGMTEVRVKLLKPDGNLIARLPRHRVTPSPPLMADLKALLGPSCLAS
jgi:DNA polymerase-3 subunit alpha